MSAPIGRDSRRPWCAGKRLAIIRAAVKDPTYRQRYREFLKRLRKARSDARLTQVDVAKRLRRPQSFVPKCESGERRVDVVELAEFARLYHKPMSSFVGQVGERNR
jgi:ribosome-binding protein aMBF1 (putative translation factor)